MPTTLQDRVVDAIRNYEKENGRYPRQIDLINFIKLNNIDLKHERANINDFTRLLEKQGVVQRVTDYEEVTTPERTYKIPAKTTKRKITRIKLLK